MLLSKSATTVTTSTPSIIISLEDDWKSVWKWLSTWVFVVIAFAALLPDVAPSLSGVIPSNYIAILAIIGILARVIKQGESKGDANVVAADAKVTTVLNEINNTSGTNSGGLTQKLTLAGNFLSEVETAKALLSGTTPSTNTVEKVESILSTVAAVTSTNITPTATPTDVSATQTATSALATAAPIIEEIAAVVEKKA